MNSKVLASFAFVFISALSLQLEAAPKKKSSHQSLAEKLKIFEAAPLSPDSLGKLDLPIGYMGSDKKGVIRVFKKTNLIPQKYLKQMDAVGRFAYRIVGYNAPSWREELFKSLSIGSKKSPSVFHVEKGQDFKVYFQTITMNNSNINPCENGRMEPVVEIRFEIAHQKKPKKKTSFDHSLAFLWPSSFSSSVVSSGKDFSLLRNHIKTLPNDFPSNAAPSALIKVTTKNHEFYIDHTSSVGQWESWREYKAYYIKNGKVVQFNEPITKEICEAV